MYKDLNKQYENFNKKDIVGLYDILFCPFCGNNHIYSDDWFHHISKCVKCGARFQVYEMINSERNRD